MAQHNTLNARLKDLLFSRGSGPVLLGNPVFLSFSGGGVWTPCPSPLWIRTCLSRAIFAPTSLRRYAKRRPLLRLDSWTGLIIEERFQARYNMGWPVCFCLNSSNLCPSSRDIDYSVGISVPTRDNDPQNLILATGRICHRH